MSNPGRELCTYNVICNLESASIAAIIISEITHKRPFLLTYCFISESLPDSCSDNLGYYPFCAENPSVGVMLDIYWIYLFTSSQPQILNYVVSLYGVYGPIFV